MKYNILLVGPVGTGKTTSLRTIVEECDRELFVVATEPGIQNILGDESRDGPLPVEKCHWHYVSPASTTWEHLIHSGKLVNAADMNSLAKIQGGPKREYQQFIELLSVLSNFKCERTGEEFGPVDSWNEGRVLAIDGLSGISQMALDLVVGAKPVVALVEWQAAMAMVLRLIRKLCSDTRCSFILNAHLERQIDEMGGGTHLTVSTLGNKLAPELIKPFDEIICTKRVRDDFKWSTTEMQIDLKTRVLGWGDDYKPTFSHFFKNGK